MQVTYEAGAAKGAFECDYPNLYHCIRRLEDNLVCYVLRGDPDLLLGSTYDRSGMPKIVRATFDSALAEKYERKVEAYFSRPAAGREFPVPSFSVLLEIDYGTKAESAAFDYGQYGRETLIAFCEHVAQRSAYFHRHRFSKR